MGYRSADSVMFAMIQTKLAPAAPFKCGSILDDIELSYADAGMQERP